MGLAALVAFCVRRRRLVLLLALLVAAASLATVATRLQISTESGDLFSASLPWKRRTEVLDRAFPQHDNLLVAVIDADLPEEAELTARDLATALAADTADFTAVSQPDSSPYLERNGFLFLDQPTLEALLDHLVDAQPFLGDLAADPSLRGLCSALALIAQGVEVGQAELDPFLPALRGFHAALAAAASGDARPISWERLMAGPLADLAGRFHFVLAHPRPGTTGEAAMRAAIARLEYVRAGQARVRLTGEAVLSEAEFRSVTQGMALTGTAGAVLALLWLFLAVRSWRLVVPILLCLGLALLATAAFAALAIGKLTLVSVAFPVLLTGVAVDFAIQFSIRFQAEHRLEEGVATGVVHVGEHAGRQILLAALTASAGFLAFTPTRFLGVAQLGAIAGAGILIAAACTLTVLPSLLALLRPRPVAEAGLPVLRRLDRPLTRLRLPVLAFFAALGLAGLLLTPRIPFDGDPLHAQNPNTEPMRTLVDLMGDPITTPYSADVLVPDAATAARLSEQLAALPQVGAVISFASFVPTEQPAKLAMIQDAAGMLAITLASPPPVPPLTPASLRASVQEAASGLGRVLNKLPPGHPLALITQDLRRLQDAPDPVLLAASGAITRFLPLQLERLRTALATTGATDADVPAAIRSDWVAADGQMRLQVTPKGAIRDAKALRRFVAAVERVAPGAAGAAVTIVGSAQTVIESFRLAAVLATILVAAMLAIMLRRLQDVALVMGALLLSLLLATVAALAVGLTFNFANIVALPLTLGVGVSFNVYFVMNWRAGLRHPLGSATARAVVFSALTTGTAFGCLALSPHPGTASMGRMLLLSLLCTACVTLVAMPAALAVRRDRNQPMDAALRG